MTKFLLGVYVGASMVLMYGLMQQISQMAAAVERNA